MIFIVYTSLLTSPLLTIHAYFCPSSNFESLSLYSYVVVLIPSLRMKAGLFFIAASADWVPWIGTIFKVYDSALGKGVHIKIFGGTVSPSSSCASSTGEIK